VTHVRSVDELEAYFAGKALYGDDFSDSQIAEWYADEKEAYAELGAKDASTYRYGYHATNILHAFRHFRATRFASAMGFGSAYGDEFLPIASKIGALTIVDPSDAFSRSDVHGIPTTYVKPDPSGRLPFRDDQFDLITCFGVLHHIPNVSFVLAELARVLQPGGYLALNEPIKSMGDWRLPRRGLTKRERGIPIAILRGMVRSCGFDVLRTSFWAFPVTHRLFNGLRSKRYDGIYNNPFIARVDSVLATAFAWNVTYHPRSLFKRFSPGSAYLLLTKSPQACPQPGLTIP
jgi:SAM-dependent methyltransferase